jgi:hypothetical protein
MILEATTRSRNQSLPLLRSRDQILRLGGLPSRPRDQSDPGDLSRAGTDEPVELARAAPRSGNSCMNRKKRLSLWAACLEVGGYPELLLNLASQHGLEIHRKGRARYVNRDDLGSLGRYVRAWLDRPRMSRAVGLTGRAEPHASDTIARPVEAITDRAVPSDVED